MKNASKKKAKSGVKPKKNIFSPGTWLTKIDFINHLILFNNVIISLLAEKGGGKTTFISVMQAHLDSKIKPVLFVPTSACTTDAILAHVCTELAIEMQTDLTAVVDHVEKTQQHVLLIIDNAQYVSESFVQESMTVIKAQAEPSYFHVCLVSDLTLVTTLDKLSVNQYTNIVHSIEIGELNETETRTYVMQKALAENWISAPLPAAAYKEFYQITKGNLAKINVQMEAYLSKCEPEPQKMTQADPKLKRISVAITSLLFVGCAYLYVNKFYSPPTQAFTQPKLEQQSEKKEQEQKLVSYTEPVPALEVIAAAEDLDSYIPFWMDSAKIQLVQSSMPKQINFEDFDNEEDHIKTEGIVDKVVFIPKIKPQAKNSEKPVKPAKPVKQHALTKSINSFTIQILASHTKEPVTRLRHKNKALAHAKIMHFSNEKGSWYVLTLGEFKNRAQAQAKVKTLSDDLSPYHPWVRPVAGLKSVG